MQDAGLNWGFYSRGQGRGQSPNKNTDSKTVQIATRVKYKIKPSDGTEGDVRGFFREDGQSRRDLM